MSKRLFETPISVRRTAVYYQLIDASGSPVAFISITKDDAMVAETLAKLINESPLEDLPNA